MFRQVRYAFRHLSRARGFSVLAVSTLALAGGATGALLSLLNAIVLRPLDVPEPERLAVVTVSNDDGLQGFVSLPAVRELQRTQDVFEMLCGTTGGATARVQIGGVLTTVTRESITGDCHRIMHARAQLGRVLTERDFADAQPVVVISDSFWRQHLGSDPAVIGKPLQIEGSPLTIVGVIAPASASSIALDQAPDLVIPLSLMDRLLNSPVALRAYYLIGRLRPGVTLAAAEARVGALWPEVFKLTASGADPVGQQYMRGLSRVRVESGSHGISPLRKRYARPLQVLLGLGALVLVVACCNVGALVLTRMLAREGELAVHLALGSTWGQVARQFLVEGAMLGLAAAIVAVPLTYWFAQSLAALLWTSTTALTLSVTPDVSVIAALCVGGLLCGTLIGLPPVALWRLRPARPGASSRGVVRGTGWLGKGLIVGQLAIALALMSSAAVFMRNLAEIRSIDPGYDTKGLLFMRPVPVPGPPPRIDMAEHQKELMTRLSAIPGVRGAALSIQFPFVIKDGIPAAPTRAVDSGAEIPNVPALPDYVSPEFFDLAGMQVMRGRRFSWDDHASHPPVAIINASLAARLFGTADPIGKRILISSGPKPTPAEVVGVVSDASPGDVRITRLPMAYRPIFQEPVLLRNPVIILRAQATDGLRETVRQTVASLGRSYVVSVRSIDEQIDRTLVAERALFVLSVFVGGLSLLLAALGLHGLFAYSVRQRSRELGVRLALGASSTSVRRLVLMESVLVAVAGVIVGVPLALASGLVSRALLTEIPTPSLPLIAICASALVIVGILAVAGPARRAARTDAAIALRAE